MKYSFIVFLKLICSSKEHLPYKPLCVALQAAKHQLRCVGSWQDFLNSVISENISKKPINITSQLFSAVKILNCFQ